MYLTSSTAPNPCVVFEPGLMPRHVLFIGAQNWVRGGLYWYDNGAVPRNITNPRRDHLVIENLRVEGIGNQPSVYAIDLNVNPAYPLDRLRIVNSLLAGNNAQWNGLRVGGVDQALIDNCTYLGLLTPASVASEVSAYAIASPHFTNIGPITFPSTVSFRR
jgi:hypothetical protein